MDTSELRVLQDKTSVSDGNTQQNSQDDSMEIIADPSKYVTLPIQNERIWRKYEKSLSWFWTVYEVNYDKDRVDMLEVFDPEQCEYLQKLLALMALMHNAVVKKELFLDLINQVDIKEASYYFGSQADSKKTHHMMYTLLLDDLTGDASTKAKIKNEVEGLQEVREALDWYVKAINMEEESFARRMLTFATLQGIFFLVPFVVLSWLENKYPSKLCGLMKSNNLIWRDERLNLSLSCMLLSEIEDEVEDGEVERIIKTAVHHAKSVFTKALPVSKFGFDTNLMGEFIEHSADIILSETNNKKIYHVETPFDWTVKPRLELDDKPVTNVMTTSASTINAVGEATFDLDNDF